MQNDFPLSESDAIEKKIRHLSEKLRLFQHEYYVLAHPSVEDSEYDRLFDTLVQLEKEYPQYLFTDSPTQRVGSDLSSEFPEVNHSIPVLSLDKAYSVEELVSWSSRIAIKSEDTPLSFVVEEKIDGISIVLYYEEGVLTKAVTRGNGFIGNDVTANVKTIGAVPLRLAEPISLSVRGEIYLPVAGFEELNSRQSVPYANPRNLAAGTIRRIKSVETAAVPLQIFCYEGFFNAEAFEPQSHREILDKLHSLGFRINPRVAWFSTEEREGYQSLSELAGWIKKMTEERSHLPYEIDGLVMKVNEIPLRDRLGYTDHHPRWAVAYKFESPTGESIIKEIDVQVGRTGRLTPVARIEPVEISGSMVSNVTLHNQDYINALEVSVGDRVSVSKRGDVIPAVEMVIEKGEYATPFQMPEICPSCGSKTVLEGAHHFCKNPDCDAQRLGQLLFFASRSQMNIEGLGAETLSFLFREKLVQSIPEIYYFDYERLIPYDGFGVKKVKTIKEGVEASKKQPFDLTLSSLGLKELGPKVCEILIQAGYATIDQLIEAAQLRDLAIFEKIKGIGSITAMGIIDSLTSEKNLKLIEDLRTSGLNWEVKEVHAPSSALFAGTVWCITGSFEHFKPRELAGEEIKKRSGVVTSTVSGSTTHLLAGEKGGSKMEKAERKGVQIVDEALFLRWLENDSMEV